MDVAASGVFVQQQLADYRLCLSSDFPELQEKIRTAMIEGKIADEDFNGDPEFNMLGQRGIRRAVRKSKAKDGEGDEQEGQVCIALSSHIYQRCTGTNEPLTHVTG